MVYEWVKALHIISVIAWMAGMFYLPRLFVYHADKAVGSEVSETFKVMERRLLKAIINPAMIASWTFGLTLIILGQWMSQPGAGWLHGKLLLVLLMSGVHGVLAGHVRRFARDERPKPANYYRVLNEVPTVLMVLIVLLVVLKPF